MNFNLEFGLRAILVILKRINGSSHFLRAHINKTIKKNWTVFKDTSTIVCRKLVSDLTVWPIFTIFLWYMRNQCMRFGPIVVLDVRNSLDDLDHENESYKSAKG